MLMRYAVKLKVLLGKLFYILVKDSCEQSGVNTMESLQGFHPISCILEDSSLLF